MDNMVRYHKEQYYKSIWHDILQIITKKFNNTFIAKYKDEYIKADDENLDKFSLNTNEIADTIGLIDEYVTKMIENNKP